MVALNHMPTTKQAQKSRLGGRLDWVAVVLVGGRCLQWLLAHGLGKDGHQFIHVLV